MYNLTHSAKITESKAMNLIFNASRANEKRSEWKNDEGFSVSFMLSVDGNYSAFLSNPAVEMVAVASVDEFDC